eukprot:Gb_40524 [translate_table: standard]
MEDLGRLQACWFFKDFTLIRVEGVAREIEGMNLPHRGSRRQWDPFGRVQGNLLAGKKSSKESNRPKERTVEKKNSRRPISLPFGEHPHSQSPLVPGSSLTIPLSIEFRRMPLMDPINTAHLKGAQYSTPQSIIEEARGKGEDTHHKIEASLKKMNEWETKLATVKRVDRKNLLPNLSLLELDEVITCENSLAKTKHALKYGDAPLVSSNRQLESSLCNIRTLLNNAVLSPVVKPNNSFPSEVELDATLGEFTTQFCLQFIGINLRGIPWDIIEVDPNTMEHKEEKSNSKKSQGVQHSPTHVSWWEMYLMAKEMTKYLKFDISGLDKSIKAMQEELRQVKEATQEHEDFIKSSMMEHGRFSNGFLTKGCSSVTMVIL